MDYPEYKRNTVAIPVVPPAAPVQEPVMRRTTREEKIVRPGVYAVPVAPAAQRQWVDMPELELLGAYEEEQQGRWGDHVRGLLNVQAKLREKNGG